MSITERISWFLQTTQIPFSILSFIKQQQKFLKKNIDPKLVAAQQMADGSLDENDIKKINGYYGLAVPAILGEAFCALHGKTMTVKERLASTCQGAMTGLGDDFFDRQRLSEQGVKDFIERPEEFTGNTASEKLFLDFYKTALANAPQAKEMQQQIYKVFYAQLLSKQQDKPGLTYEEIQKITILKGAESLLYYRTAFEQPLQNGEYDMLYNLGGLMQLSNDIFDVYKDHKSGVNTLITTANNINDLRAAYTALLNSCSSMAYQSAYAQKNISKFLAILNIGIFCRCYVCLDQLEGLEEKSVGIFNLKMYSRKDLICDMDTAANKWRSLKYLFKLSR